MIAPAGNACVLIAPPHVVRMHTRGAACAPSQPYSWTQTMAPALNRMDALRFAEGENT